MVTLFQKQDLDLIEFSIVRDIESEVVQALGYYLDITPRFFNFSYSRLSAGTPIEQCMYIILAELD